MTLISEDFTAMAEAHERQAVQLRAGESLSDPSDITPDVLATIAYHFAVAAGLRAIEVQANAKEAKDATT